MAIREHEQPLPLWEHLEALRRVLLLSAAVIAVGTALGFLLVDPVLSVLMAPLTRVAAETGVILNQASPFDAILIKFKVAVLTGIVLAMPAMLALLWRFVSPGLHDREVRLFWEVCGAGSLLFLGGVILGFLAIGQMLPMLATFSIADAANIWSLRAYFDFLFFWLLATGLSCELPLVMLMLSRLGILAPASLRRSRPYAVVAIFIVAALATPPDVITQLMLAIPLWILFEAGLLLADLVAPHPLDQPE
jgi:sec-independent protein translocase protein TatC